MALPIDHPLSRHGALTLAALADEAFIIWPMVEGRSFHLQTIRLCARVGFVPRVTQEAHGMHAILSLVGVGAGVSIVPQSMASFRPDRIAYHSIKGPEAAFELALAVSEPTPADNAFVDLARDVTSP